MFQLGSRLAHITLPSGSGDSSSSQSAADPGGSGGLGFAGSGAQVREEKIPSLPEFLKHVRRVTGLKKEDVFCDLRVPSLFQTTREEINIVIVTGSGVYCVDVKPWTGGVSAQGTNTWHLQTKEEKPNFTNTSIQQVPDPLQGITRKAGDLCAHLKRCGVKVRQSLFIPRVLFLSPLCVLDDELRKRKELVPHSEVDMFLRSLREGYMTWITDTLTPSWISGHLSFRQLGAIRAVLGQMGTWDLVQLSCGAELKGDYQGCQHLALNRQDTDLLEFRRGRILSTDTLWALLGHTPQGHDGESASEREDIYSPYLTGSE
ncbi:uncharacterized protein si:zfos-911d5.4 isoform X2 [Hoplias malabaricus]|uniref:uncharacterized protein si:zfos-911d5.4 isoform X2 n=1 Tax=Hoplias malabaricus TaxID=27720 RepID=UPI003463447E